MTERISLPVPGPRGKKARMGLTALRDGVDLGAPLYAVNLLDRRRPRLYELYNLLAFPFARRAGARVLWKGHRLDGRRGEDLRETLLIVRYPQGERFLRMILRPGFALISILRRWGLENFQFGFAERRPGDAAEPPAAKVPRRYDGAAHYRVIVGRGENALERLEALSHGPDQPVRAVFLGHTAAIVEAEQPAADSRPTRQAPPLPWDALLLLEAEDEATLESSDLADRLGAEIEWATARYYRVL